MFLPDAKSHPQIHMFLGHDNSGKYLSKPLFLLIGAELQECVVRASFFGHALNWQLFVVAQVRLEKLAQLFNDPFFVAVPVYTRHAHERGRSPHNRLLIVYHSFK